MSEVAKLNFLEQIHNFVRTKGADLFQNMPKAIQGHVSAIKENDFIEFTIDANGPWTLPKIIIPQAFSKYHREPTAVGDKGYAVPNDYFIGGESGQDGSTATMYPRGNLSTLTFHPVSNKNWPKKDPNLFLVTAGSKGHTTQSADGKTTRTIDDSNNIKDTSSAAVTSKAGTTNTVASTNQDVNIVPSQSGKVTVGASSSPNQDPPVPSVATLMNVIGSISASGNMLAGGMMGAAGGFSGAGGGTNAPAGGVGEVISSNITTGVNCGSGVQQNITSIVLTPGDWDIQGEAWIQTGAGGATGLQACLSTVSGTFPGSSSLNQSRTTLYTSWTANIPQCLPLRTCRANVTVNTTYYLIVFAAFPSGTVTATGSIWARRMR